MSSSGLVSIAPIRDESPILLIPPSIQHNPESILIHVDISGSGSTVPLRVLQSDSIESVKFRIQNCQGTFVRNQKLVFGGKELCGSNSLAQDYGVKHGNVLHLVLRFRHLQVINVRTCCGKEFTFYLEGSRDVGYVKHQIADKRNLDEIEDHEVLLNGIPVEDQQLINDLYKENADAVIHLFVRKTAKIRATPVGRNFELSITAPPPRTTLLEPLIVNPKIELQPEIWDMIKATRDGLERGNYPIMTSDGTGGAYFMVDASGRKYASIFKPANKEPMAVHNPRGLPVSEDGEGLKKGTRVGEGGIRECAAYLLDHPKTGRRSFSGELMGFSGVPPTVYVQCLHRGFNQPGDLVVKSGSLQMFVENNGSCEDVGPSGFPVEEVHKIAVLDMRLANADRHAGNILISEGVDGRTVLTPIDHGYCLPCSFEDCTFDWLYWPQARQHFRDNTVEYIRSMNAEEDIALLKFHRWDMPIECARVLRISTILLQKGVEKGLTPMAIGSMMCRENVKERSVVEKIVQEAWESVLPGSGEAAFLECWLPGSGEAAFLECVSSIMDRRLKEMS